MLSLYKAESKCCLLQGRNSLHDLEDHDAMGRLRQGRNSVQCLQEHGVVGRRFNSVWYDWCKQGCGMCYPVYGMVHIKYPLVPIEESGPCSGDSGFCVSHYLSRPLLYVLLHITVNEMCCVNR